MKTAARVVERVLGLADASFSRNQFNASALVDVPSLSGSSTSTATLNDLTRFYVSDASVPAPWNRYGGDVVEDSGGTYLVSVISDGDTSPPTRSPQSGQYEFILDDNQIEFEVDISKPYRFLIEDFDGVLKPLDLGEALVTSGSKAFYLLGFATRRHRRIQLDVFVDSSGGYTSGRFYGARVHDDGQVFAPFTDGIRAVITGDSWSQGRNGPASDSFSNVALKMLGIRDVRTASVGGTGVQAQPDDHALRYANRQSDWYDAAPHIMVEMVSGNDWAAAAYNGNDAYYPTLVEAHEASVDARRTAYPNSIIIVRGMDISKDEEVVSGFSGYDLNDAVKAMVLSKNDNYIRYIDPNVSVGGEGPITGVFHWSGTESDGTGSTVPYFADHMTPAGDLHQGIWFGQQLLRTFRDMFYGETGDVIEASFDVVEGTALVFEGQEITVPIALATGSAGISLGELDSDPALPSGLSVDVISGGKLQLTGTPTTALGSGDYTLSAERIDHGDPVEFTLHLEAYGEPNWVHKADESEEFVLTESSVIRFGVGGTWWYKRVPSGTYTSAVFGGDPKPFWVKTVEIDTTA